MQSYSSRVGNEQQSSKYQQRKQSNSKLVVISGNFMNSFNVSDSTVNRKNPKALL